MTMSSSAGASASVPMDITATDNTSSHLTISNNNVNNNSNKGGSSAHYYQNINNRDEVLNVLNALLVATHQQRQHHRHQRQRSDSEGSLSRVVLADCQYCARGGCAQIQVSPWRAAPHVCPLRQL
eukprot:GEZU01026964.1.p3 GENE.GEZU01026964.1~~GEZU01026964.1.p3  ORF type:complete len:125 (-),score=23.86 GEZU01026964.1:620-994(-)